MNPAYKYLFKNYNKFSKPFFLKTVKFSPAISKLDSYVLQYLIQFPMTLSLRFYKANISASTNHGLRQLYLIMHVLDTILLSYHDIVPCKISDDTRVQDKKVQNYA